MSTGQIVRVEEKPDENCALSVSTDARATSNPYAKFNRACRAGQLDVLQDLFADSHFLKHLKESETMVGTACSRAQWGISSAAICGQVKVIKYLMDLGVSLDSSRIQNVLQTACFGGSLETVKFLIEEYGARPTPEMLESAASNEGLEVIKYLISDWKLKPSQKAIRLAREDLEDNDRNKGGIGKEKAMAVIAYLETYFRSSLDTKTKMKPCQGALESKTRRNPKRSAMQVHQKKEREKREKRMRQGPKNEEREL
jgi:hypothetical protein